jgi:hypothetical protein
MQESLLERSKEGEALVRVTSREEHYLATKQIYGRLFAQAEGLRWTLKQIARGIDPADVNEIESEVREHIRKQRTQQEAIGDMYIQLMEEKKKGKFPDTDYYELLKKAREIVKHKTKKPPLKAKR